VLDAGTRVGRFMGSGSRGAVSGSPLAAPPWMPSVSAVLAPSSSLLWALLSLPGRVLIRWVNQFAVASLWISNQLLAAVALVVATTILDENGAASGGSG